MGGGDEGVCVNTDDYIRAMDKLVASTKYDPPTGPQYAWASEDGRAKLEQATGRKWYAHPDDPCRLCSEPWPTETPSP